MATRWAVVGDLRPVDCFPVHRERHRASPPVEGQLEVRNRLSALAVKRLTLTTYVNGDRDGSFGSRHNGDDIPGAICGGCAAALTPAGT